jgi:PAS domain-containing protein
LKAKKYTPAKIGYNMVNKSITQSLPEKYKKNKERLLFYEKVFSNLNAIVFVFDLIDYKMLWVNNAFNKILGYQKTTRSIPEQEMLDVYHPDDRMCCARCAIFSAIINRQVLLPCSSSGM